MNITKLTHACLLIESNQKQLLIDPGIFTEDIPELPYLSAIVITHAHPDHINDAWLSELQSEKPDVPIYTVQQVADTFPNIKFEVVTEQQTLNVDTFSITCWPTDHATIHPELPTFQNMAIMVNDTLFYPGDSFFNPGIAVPVLACPASAPWLKISEAIDYIRAIKAERVFPTHNALLSDIGGNIHYGMLESACNDVNSSWHFAIAGEQIEI